MTMDWTVDKELESLVAKALEYARIAAEERVRRKALNRAAHRALRERAAHAGPKPRCGARRKRDGLPCQAQALPRGRCKLHGGMSTGPRTEAGKVRALANLWRGRSAT